MNYQQKLNALGLEIPSILLPKNNEPLNMEKWAIIACDQFTQDRNYWEKVKDSAAGSPSTINLIFPEVFLADGDAETRIKNIHSTMTRYLNEGVFAEPKPGFIYIERDTPFQKKRRGLVAAIDLEHYDWKPDSRPLVRSTEGTVEDRLPPRMNIRRGAPLELPHVLLLIDDDTDSILPALGKIAKSYEPVYSTKLMPDSGSVSGWFLDSDENILSILTEKLEELCRRSADRYGKESEKAEPFLFAVGDGNHSLAAAKGIWEECKANHKGNGLPDSPCRYALVEIENIYDPAIQFEPIHRVIFDTGFDEVISLLSALPDFSCRQVRDSDELALLCETSKINCFGIISEECYALVETSAKGISTACLQPLLDKYSKEKSKEIDYIHDKEEVFRLAKASLAQNKERLAVGILLPPIQKAGLFETVGRLGPLPRKSFSMGHSCEKRFYLECRRL